MFRKCIKKVNKSVNLNKKKPRDKGFIRLSYVVLTRDFNMNVVVNILVNVSNLFRAVILKKNAILDERGITHKKINMP